MKCKQCNNDLKETDKFCPKCGEKVNSRKKKGETQVEVVQPQKSSKGTAIASLVLGIISFFFGAILLPLPIIGLILGITNKEKCGERIAGIILNTTSLAYAILVWIFVGFTLTNIVDRLIYGEIQDDEREHYNYNIDDMLNRLDNWDKYSYARYGKLGKLKELNGGWRVLGDTKSYWVFRDGEFWWYKNYTDLNDNYWYGKYNVEIGRAALEKVGVPEYRLNTLFSREYESIDDSNIYVITMTPKVLIANGVNKSEDNIVEGFKWEYVWILVDHGEEGIEAQVLSVDRFETSYYVKTAD